MSKNITLMGANYPDVPAVELPQTGGGIARFIDEDTLSIQSASSPATNTITFYKTGKTVMMHVKGYKVVTSGNLNNAIPTGYAPIEHWRGMLSDSNGDNICDVYIRTTGTIEFTPKTLNINYYGSVTFPLG